MKTAYIPLQTALYQRLANHTRLQQITAGRVYDYVPPDTKFPYVQIGEPIQAPFADKTSYGEEIDFTIHTWSKGLGKAESYRMIEAILQALYTQPLSLGSGFSIVHMDDPRTRVFDDIDGLKRHGVVTLKFYIK